MMTALASTQAWSAVPFHHVLPPCQVPLPSEAPLLLGSQISVVAAWAGPIASSIPARPRTQPSGRGQGNRPNSVGIGDNTGVNPVIGLIFIVSCARKANSPATVARRGDHTELPLTMPHVGLLSS